MKRRISTCLAANAMGSTKHSNQPKINKASLGRLKN